MHYNLMSPDVMSVILGLNYEAHNAAAYKFNNSAIRGGWAKIAEWEYRVVPTTEPLVYI